jgi:hypothetical protein
MADNMTSQNIDLSSWDNLYTSILRVGFEPTILVFGRTKTVHALDRVTPGIGSNLNLLLLI